MVAMPGPEQPDYLDLKQLCKLLPLSARTIRERVHDPIDSLPAYKLGRKLVFKRSEIMAYLEKHRYKPTDVQQAADEILTQLRKGSNGNSARREPQEEAAPRV